VIRIHIRTGGGAAAGPLSVNVLELPAGASLRDALGKLAGDRGMALPGAMTLVAVNGRRIGVERHADLLLADGDVVSVIHAVAGG
jgi:sulfur carrier protein ThiS